MTPQRGRLGTYALWQLRDYASGPMIWTMLAGLFFGGMPMLMMRLHASRMPGGEIPYAQAFEAYVSVIGLAAPMLAMVRLVAGDRAPGLTRFLFAKPISVRAYYAQAWVVRLAAGMAMVTLLALVLNTFIGNVPWLAGAGAIGIAFVLIGGVGFLMSVLTKLDGGATLVVYLIPGMLNQITQARPEWDWVVKPLLKILPPMHRLDDIRRAMLNDAPFPQSEALHALLYGAGCFALGVYLVRRLPLVR